MFSIESCSTKDGLGKCKKTQISLFSFEYLLLLDLSFQLIQSNVVRSTTRLGNTLCVCNHAHYDSDMIFSDMLCVSYILSTTADYIQLSNSSSFVR